MGVKLLGYLSLSWWTATLLYYAFFIIAFISKAYISLFAVSQTLLYPLFFQAPRLTLKKYSHELDKK